MRWLAVGILGWCWAGPACALSGVVTHVTDGDTLWIRPEGRAPLKVRLQGIDAPERCQAWGAQARQALASQVMHRQVQVHPSATDDYHRTIGTVEVEGRDVAAWMVREGHAWSQRYRKSLGRYGAEEAEARRLRRGLFSAPAIEPREFRKAHGACR